MDDLRIKTLQQALAESSIEPSERDALADDLEYAQIINGHKDETMQGIKRIVISGVRREMLSHARTKDAIRTHASECRGVVERSTGSTTMDVIRALTPWRWPLALAVFSPFAGDVAAKVVGIFVKAKGG